MLGIGGIAFLFGEIVKFQAENAIQKAAGDQVHALESTLGQTKTLAEAFRTSVLTLHKQKAETPATYRNLTFELFKARPDFVRGLGLGQSKNGILPAQPWFFSYYYLDTDQPNAVGQLLPSPHNDIRYVNGTEPGNFYPETDRYKNYFSPQKDIWVFPSTPDHQTQATYYSQILDDQGDWLGTVFVDLDSTIFNNTLKQPVLYNAGFFALLTEEGEIIASPAASNPAAQSGTYQSIPGLASVWSTILDNPSGLVEGDQGYWSYARVPGNNWITIAFVPYRAVFNRIILSAVGSMIAAGLLLSVVLALSLRYINYRLRPILTECNRLAATDNDTLTLSQHQDEIGQLSIAFFNLLEQIKTHEEKIRQSVARTAQAEAQLKQLETQELTGQTLQTDLSHFFNVVSAVEQGNLTVTAQASSPLVSDVADALNRLVERLARMMAIVFHATEQMRQGAENLERLAVDVATNTQQQNQSVLHVQTLIEKTSKLSQDTVLQAVATNEAVQLAQSAIVQGQQEIAAITKGITVLEQDTGQIVKRTQTLTSYVELATQFAKDQKRIAAMTRILALNASMLASRASAQQDPEQLAVITREFETIAGQVNTLASQTNQSLVVLQQRTDQIQTVVSGLNYDVQEISQQVNHFTIGVDQSRKAFDTIKTVNDRVAQMGQRMMQSSQTIADAAQLVSESIQEISTIASTTLSQTDVTQEQSRNMEHLAHTLMHNVEFFQLPVKKAIGKDEE
jgi:twitching motility protein PilJ